MCGVIGFNFNDRYLADSMLHILHHRGPDHKEIYELENLTLGYTRLGIIDLKNGNQPFYNETESIIVFFNGEIFNSKEIKKDLEAKKHTIESDCDGEVIAHCFEEYGYYFLKKLRGMFSIVLYNTDKKELIIGRDRLGIKPLYYFWQKGLFVFASEIKAMLQLKSIERKVNLKKLSEYFSFRYCTGEKTIFEGISKLLPGHFLIFKDNKVKVIKYWDLDFKINESKDIYYYDATFKKLFESSVKDTMLSDVPFGLLLSGGIDSSAIAAMLRKNTDEKIKTYTIGFDQGFDNEFKYSRLVADKFSLDNKEYLIDSSSVKLLPKILWHLDEPVADPTAIPNYILAKKAARDVKVLINGDGADEMFGGYEQYKIMYSMNKLPKLIKSPLHRIVSLLPKEPFFDKLKSFTSERSDSNAYSDLISVFGKSEKKELFTLSLNKKLRGEDIQKGKVEKLFLEKGNSLNKMLYYDIKTFLPDNMLLKYDKITMAHSIEGRVPFCDHILAEFSATLPNDLKLAKELFGYNEKYLIKRSMKDMLPKEIIYRKKQRFLVPTDNWMNNGLREYSQTIIDNNSDIVKDYFKKEYINNLLNDKFFFSNSLLKCNNLTKLYYSRQMWTITNFLVWHNLFMQKDLTAINT